MSRKLPPFVPGHYYHIYNRGAHRLSIFREPENYLFILRLLKQYLQELDLTIIVYCLMPNHYHLLIRQNGELAAGKLPQLIFNSYSKAYNKRYEHSGTLFEGPYDARHVHNENYLRHLCRYIHANPVKDGLVSRLEEWPYSNYLEWIGQRPGKLVDMEFINTYFPNPGEYQQFVLDYLIERKLIGELSYLE
ncbi:MAG TPA: transposase [Chloroflexota bacterium]|nr:transposase [Chloroflexota bacterium]HUM68875.1 transposase [Chloroflexota bacterium]